MRGHVTMLRRSRGGTSLSAAPAWCQLSMHVLSTHGKCIVQWAAMHMPPAPMRACARSVTTAGRSESAEACFVPALATRIICLAGHEACQPTSRRRGQQDAFEGNSGFKTWAVRTNLLAPLQTRRRTHVPCSQRGVHLGRHLRGVHPQRISTREVDEVWPLGGGRVALCKSPE